MKRLPVFLVFIFSCLLPFTAQAQIKTFVHTVRQPFGGSQSPDDARIAAIVKAKREVLEIAGTYIESLFIAEETEEKIFAKDQVLALTSGILKTEIISQKNYVTEDGFGIIVKARVQVDTSLLEERIKKLIADRTAMEQLISVREREKELLDKVEILEEKNRELAKQVESQANKEVKKALAQQFKQASRGLNAVSLNEQALTLGQNGKYTKALELLNKAIELDPNYAKVYSNRGNAYICLKQYTKAIQDYNRAIELDPNDAIAYSNRGSIFVAEMGLKEKGCADLRKACELGFCEDWQWAREKGYCF